MGEFKPEVSVVVVPKAEDKPEMVSKLVERPNGTYTVQILAKKVNPKEVKDYSMKVNVADPFRSDKSRLVREFNVTGNGKFKGEPDVVVAVRESEYPDKHLVPVKINVSSERYPIGTEAPSGNFKPANLVDPPRKRVTDAGVFPQKPINERPNVLKKTGLPEEPVSKESAGISKGQESAATSEKVVVVKESVQRVSGEISDAMVIERIERMMRAEQRAKDLEDENRVLTRTIARLQAEVDRLKELSK